MNHSQFTIQQLRIQNGVKILESVLLFVAALYITALLPSILMQFFYNQEELFAQPQALMYIPVVSFAVAIGYFIYALVGNFRRYQQIAQLERELVLEPSTGPDQLSNQEMKELESLVDQALKKPSKSKVVKKTSTPTRSSKKTGKRSK